jgi:hypothetical protein
MCAPINRPALGDHPAPGIAAGNEQNLNLPQMHAPTNRAALRGANGRGYGRQGTLKHLLNLNAWLPKSSLLRLVMT